ncbi:MAG: PAS domain S-box protein [Kiritimatiellia bacterium]|jgi:PAS domain S-box-containing protein|nr:PAS domain S-box protein [Kiritimatiellia bacterium]
MMSLSGLPVRLLIAILVMVFLMEAAIMLILPLTSIPRSYEWFLDAGILSVVLSVGLYFVLTRHISQVLRRLEDSERLHRAMFMSSKDAIMTLDPPSWKFTSGNPACIEMFRTRDEADFISHPPWELSPERQPDGRPSMDKARDMIETAVREGNHFFEWTHKRTTGEEFPATVLLTRMEVSGKVFLEATVRDIAKWKRSQAALARAANEWQQTFDAIDAYVAIIDSDYRVVQTNRAMQEALQGQDAIGAHCYTVIHGTEQRPVDCVSCRTFETGEAVRVEVQEPHLGDRWFDIAAFPIKRPDETVTHIVHVMRDITERKLTEMALRDSEQRFRSLFDGAAEGIMVADAETRTILYANPAICGLLGYSEKELTGMDIWHLHPKDTHPAVLATFEAHVRGELQLAPDMPCRRKDATIIYMDISTAPIEIKGRDCLAGFFTDVTERRHAESIRRTLEAQVRQSQKMAAIGALASGAGHEVNNPINGIMNYAQLIEDGLESDHPLTEFARQISLEADRIASITRGLLVFASKDGAIRAPADIGDLMESALASRRDTLTRDQVAIEIDVPDGLPAIMCDCGQIRQVLESLVDNAHDALNEKYEGYHENKKIIISAREMEVSLVGGHRSLGGEETNGKSPMTDDALSEDDSDQVARAIRITIEDHGPGIPADLRERVFEPFLTTKDKAVSAGSIGKGMGLFVSYAVAQEHGGMLSTESELGEWARFHLDLPVE